MESCISWQAWLESRRQRWLDTIRFMVENERSTVAVPTGSSNSFRTAAENVGNMATLSGKTARFSMLSCVSRSPGRRRNILHSDSMSTADSPKTRATLEKSNESGFVDRQVWIWKGKTELSSQAYRLTAITGLDRCRLQRRLEILWTFQKEIIFETT